MQLLCSLVVFALGLQKGASGLSSSHFEDKVPLYCCVDVGSISVLLILDKRKPSPRRRDMSCASISSLLLLPSGAAAAFICLTPSRPQLKKECLFFTCFCYCF